jgi:hypothetical protein
MSSHGRRAHPADLPDQKGPQIRYDRLYGPPGLHGPRSPALRLAGSLASSWAAWRARAATTTMPADSDQGSLAVAAFSSHDHVTALMATARAEPGRATVPLHFAVWKALQPFLDILRHLTNFRQPCKRRRGFGDTTRCREISPFRIIPAAQFTVQ